MAATTLAFACSISPVLAQQELVPVESSDPFDLLMNKLEESEPVEQEVAPSPVPAKRPTLEPNFDLPERKQTDAPLLSFPPTLFELDRVRNALARNDAESALRIIGELARQEKYRHDPSLLRLRAKTYELLDEELAAAAAWQSWITALGVEDIDDPAEVMAEEAGREWLEKMGPRMAAIHRQIASEHFREGEFELAYSRLMQARDAHPDWDWSSDLSEVSQGYVAFHTAHSPLSDAERFLLQCGDFLPADHRERFETALQIRRAHSFASASSYDESLSIIRTVKRTDSALVAQFESGLVEALAVSYLKQGQKSKAFEIVTNAKQEGHSLCNVVTLASHLHRNELTDQQIEQMLAGALRSPLQLGESGRLIRELDSTWKELDSILNQARSALATAQSKATEAEKLIGQLQQKIESIDSRIPNMKAKMRTASSERTQAEAKITAFQSQLASADRRYETLKNQENFQNTLAFVSTVSGAMGGMTSHVNNYNDLSQTLKDVSTITKIGSEISSAIQGAQTSAEADSIRKTIRSELDSAQSAKNRIASVEALQSQITSLEQEKQGLEEQRTKERSSIASHQSAIDNARAQLAQAQQRRVVEFSKKAETLPRLIAEEIDQAGIYDFSTERWDNGVELYEDVKGRMGEMLPEERAPVIAEAKFSLTPDF